MTDHNEGCQILQSGICTCRTPVLVLNSPSYLLTDTMRLAMEAAWYAGNRAPRGETNPYSKPGAVQPDAERYNQRGDYSCYTRHEPVPGIHQDVPHPIELCMRDKA